MIDPLDAESVRAIVRGEIERERATYFLADLSKVELPIEPLYELAFVAALIPCTTWSLRGHLTRQRQHLGEPRFRYDKDARRHRMLTASEVRWLRAHIIKTGLRNKRPRPVSQPS